MSEVKTGYYVDGGDGRLYRKLHCATDSNDFLEVGPTLDQDQKYVFNIEMNFTDTDESGEVPSINLTPETAALLISDLEMYISNYKEDAK